MTPGDQPIRIEVLRRNDETVEDNYFAQVNDAFEEDVRSFEYTQGETVQEILDEHRSETSFWERVVDFFRDPVEGLKWVGIRVLDAFLGTRIAQRLFGEYIEDYERIRERYDQARDAVDSIFGEDLGVFSNAEEAFDNAISQIDRIPSIAEHIPSNLGLINRVIPDSLRNLGLLGISAYGIIRLRNDMEENPEAYQNMPTDLHEQAAWWEERLMNIGINEDLEAIIGVLTGEITLESLRQEATNESETAPEANEATPESSEEIPEGWMPLDEYIEMQEEEFQGMFSEVTEFLNEHDGFLTTSSLTLGSVFATTGAGQSVVTGLSLGSLTTLKTLGAIPLQMGPTSLGAMSVSLGGLYLLRDEYPDMLQTVGDRVIIPVDPEVRRELIRSAIERQQENLEEGANWIDQNVDIDSPEMDAALDYVSGISDIELNVDLEEFLRASTVASLELISNTPEELINNVNQEGIRGMLSRLGRQNNEDFNELVEYLEQIDQYLEYDQALTSTQIQEIIGLAENTGLVIEKSEEDTYIWYLTGEYGEEIILGPHTLAVDPELSIDEQFETAQEFRVNLRGFRSYLETFEVIPRNAQEIAQHLAEELENGSVIRFIGNEVVLQGLNSALWMGPYEVWTEVFSELADIPQRGDSFEAQEILVEYGDHVVPLLLIGTVPAIASAIRNRSMWAGAKTYGNILSAPFRVPLKVLSYASETNRAILSNSVRYRMFRISSFIPEVINERITQTAYINRLFSGSSRRMQDIQRAHSVFQLERHLLIGRRWGTRITDAQGDRVNPNKPTYIEQLRTLIGQSRIEEGRLTVDNNDIIWAEIEGQRTEINPFVTQDRERILEIVQNERNNSSDIDNLDENVDPDEPERSTNSDSEERPTQTEEAERSTETTRNIDRVELDAINHDLDRRLNSQDIDFDYEELNQRLQAQGLDPVENIRDVEARSQEISELLSNQPSRQAPRSRSQIDADTSRVAPDVSDRVRSTEAADPTRTSPSSGGRRLVSGVATTLGVTGVAVGSSSAANAMHNDGNTNVGLEAAPEEGEEEPEPELEVQSYQEDRERYEQEMLDFQIEAGNISRFYDEVSQNLSPEQIMDTDGDTFFAIASNLADEHQIRIDRFETLVRNNQDLLVAHFRMLNETMDFEENPQIKVSEALTVEFDLETERLRVRYTSAARFERTLWDNYDMVRFMSFFERQAGISIEDSPMQLMHEMTNTYYEEADRILSSNDSEQVQADRLRVLCESTIDRISQIQRSLNTFYTSSSIAAYVSPGTGSYMDLRGAGNNFARGYFGRATLDSLMFVGGTLADIFTFGTGGTAARAASAGQEVTRLGRFLDRANDSLEAYLRGGRLEALTRVSNRIDDLGHHGRRFYLSMIGLDLARPWLVAPELNQRTVIYTPEERRAQLEAREEREESLRRAESELGYNPATGRTRYTSSRHW